MDESKQDLLRSADAALTAFSCFFVIVRLLARQVSGAKWWWDDLAVVIAWAIVMTENGLGFWGTYPVPRSICTSESLTVPQ